jgi:hypothetical protein
MKSMDLVLQGSFLSSQTLYRDHYHESECGYWNWMAHEVVPNSIKVEISLL